MTTGRTTKVNIDKIVVDKQIVTDQKTMAEEFNNFFSQAGKKYSTM